MRGRPITNQSLPPETISAIRGLTVEKGLTMGSWRNDHLPGLPPAAYYTAMRGGRVHPDIVAIIAEAVTRATTCPQCEHTNNTGHCSCEQRGQ